MIVKSIKDVCTINPKGTLDSFTGSEISFVPMEAVSTTGHINTEKRIAVDRVKNYTVFREGDILFAKITPCMENGKGAIAVNLHNGYGAGSTEFIVLRPDLSQVTAKWIQLFLSQKSFRLHCQQHMTGSAGQKRVPAKFLGACTIPVPPLEEQNRIVARIEELFSELDNGVETLQNVREQVARYRYAAIENAIPYSNLRMIAECIVDMGQGWSPKCERENTIDDETWAVIKTTAVQPCNFVFEENKVLPMTLEPREKHEIQVGDILITRAGPKSRCGVCCMVRKTKKRLLNCDKVYRIRVNSAILLPEYLEYVLNSPSFIKEIALCKTGGNDSGLNLTQNRFLSIQIPVPMIDEQKQIIQEIESRLSVCDSIEKTVDTALQQAEAMRQSILKKAFEGNHITK